MSFSSLVRQLVWIIILVKNPNHMDLCTTKPHYDYFVVSELLHSLKLFGSEYVSHVSYETKNLSLTRP